MNNPWIRASIGCTLMAVGYGTWGSGKTPPPGQGHLPGSAPPQHCLPRSKSPLSMPMQPPAGRGRPSLGMLNAAWFSRYSTGDLFVIFRLATDGDPVLKGTMGHQRLSAPHICTSKAVTVESVHGTTTSCNLRSAEGFVTSELCGADLDMCHSMSSG